MRGFRGPVLFRCNRPLQISSCSAHQRLAEISCQQQGEATAESPNSAVKKKKKNPTQRSALPPLPPPITVQNGTIWKRSVICTHARSRRKRFLFAAVKTVIKNGPCQTGTRPPCGQLRFLIFWEKQSKSTLTLQRILIDPTLTFNFLISPPLP